jgi:polysaccharide deacetylase family sporulation protein PdaB
MIFTFRLKRFIALIMLAATFCAGVALSVAGDSYSVFFASSRRIPVYSVENGKKTVALTFDAAYGADKTSAIMDVLEREGVDATFFLVGFWVKNFPDKAKEIAERGFEIGTHSNVHGHMSKMGASEIKDDLDASMQRIRQATGITPTVFRAPYGEYDDKVISVAESLGLMTVQWSVDSLDWKNISKATIVERVRVKAHPGCIVLMHNNSDFVVDALPEIIAYFKAEGYEFCRVGDMIYRQNYYVDNSGRQHLKNN